MKNEDKTDNNTHDCDVHPVFNNPDGTVNGESTYNDRRGIAFNLERIDAGSGRIRSESERYAGYLFLEK